MFDETKKCLVCEAHLQCVVCGWIESKITCEMCGYENTFESYCESCDEEISI